MLVSTTGLNNREDISGLYAKWVQSLISLQDTLDE